MKLGEQPTEIEKIWRGLPVTTRREICNSFFASGERAIIDRAVLAVSKRLRTREQTVKQWPRERRATHLADMGDLSGSLMLDILRTYFFLHHKPMMATFLNSLGIEHQDCSISGENMNTPSEAALRMSIARLLGMFPREIVELYLRILVAQKSLGPALAQIDVGQIEVPQNQTFEMAMEPQSCSPSATLTDKGEELLASISGSDLTKALESVREAFRTTSALLLGATSALTAYVLPESGVEHIVSELRTRFSELSKTVFDCAHKWNLQLPAAPTDSLPGLEELIARIRHAEETFGIQRGKLEEAVSILTSVLRLERKDGRDFNALRTCQDRARVLHGELTESESGAEEIALAKVRPFRTLLLMVADRESLSEDESALAYEEISKEFGTALVLAVDRGWISLPPLASAGHVPDPPVAISGKHPDDTKPEHSGLEEQQSNTRTAVVSLPDRVASVVSVTARVEEPAQEGPAQEELGSPKEPQVPVDTRQESLPVPQSTLESPNDSAFLTALEKTAQQVASEYLAVPTGPSDLRLQALAWLAMAEQRVSAPYQMVCCIEKLDPDNLLSISSLLIRAFALGTEVRQPSGNIATQLKVDFARLVGSIEVGSSNQVFASRLMLISAALTPAFSAPLTGSGQVLKNAAQRLSGFKKLYSLCDAVADYTNGQFMLDPIALEYADNTDGWSQQVTTLKQQVDEWWEKAHGVHLRFAPAGKVWRKWLERGGANSFASFTYPQQQSRRGRCATPRSKPPLE